MNTLAVDNISLLVTNDPALGEGPLGLIRDAALVLEGDRVAAIEPAGAAADARLEAAGRCVIPGFVDSHTHLVFAGDRAEEFAARMAGAPYAPGGIAKTVRNTREATTEALRVMARARRREALRSGVTHLEIKSGYALETAGERRLCELGGELTDDVTFLGAHLVPPEYEGRADDYVALVCGDMLEACAPHARWIDVFCERGAFDADQSRAVLAAGRDVGLGLRVHANQLGPGPGVQVAVEQGAASADHCTYLSQDDLDALAGSDTVATLLLATDFSTRQPYADARGLLDAGATVALATNCNPGSSNTTSMPFCIALAVREAGLTIEEALQAATLGGAKALARDDVGCLTPGARADAVVLAAPSYAHLVYRPGVPLVAATICTGRLEWADPELLPEAAAELAARASPSPSGPAR
jgi:imidazolonepropionase